MLSLERSSRCPAHCLAAARPWRLALLTAVSVLLCAGLTTAAETVVKDGVPHVMNDAKPRDGVHQLELEELWRRGGEDDDEVLLGIVSSVLTDPEGILYLLDSQLLHVLVFGPDGRLERTLGRQGSGPGEFEIADQIAFLPGGDAIGVTQRFPGKLVGLTLDGTPAGDIRIGDPADGGFAALIGAQSGGDNLVILGIEIAFNQAEMTMDRHHFVRSYQRDGTLRHEYHTKDVHWDFNAGIKLSETENDYVWTRVGVDQEGRVLIAEPREDYRVNVYSPDGKLQRVFGRQYQSMPRNQAMLARFENIMETQARQLPPGTAREVAKNEQDIWSLRCMPDGTVWVMTSRGLFEPPTGAFTVWDVFEGDGAFVRQLEVHIPGRPGSDMLMVTEHGYAIMVTGFWDAAMSAMGAGQTDDADEAEAMQIICYRIKS